MKCGSAADPISRSAESRTDITIPNSAISLRRVSRRTATARSRASPYAQLTSTTMRLCPLSARRVAAARAHCAMRLLTYSYSNALPYALAVTQRSLRIQIQVWVGGQRNVRKQGRSIYSIGARLSSKRFSTCYRYPAGQSSRTAPTATLARHCFKLL